VKALHTETAEMKAYNLERGRMKFGFVLQEPKCLIKENIKKVAKVMKIPVEDMLWSICFYTLMILNIHKLLLVFVVSLKWVGQNRASPKLGMQ
jgi:hypothetical protein